MCHYAEFQCTEYYYGLCRYAKCHNAEYYYPERHNAQGYYALCRYAECQYVQCHYAHCHYAQCHYAQCQYAVIMFSGIMLIIIMLIRATIDMLAFFIANSTILTVFFYSCYCSKYWVCFCLHNCYCCLNCYCKYYQNNRRAHIRHQCRKTTVLRCHRCLINTGVEKMNSI